MLLDDMADAEETERRLAEGDEELAEDIERQLGEALDAFRRDLERGDAYVQGTKNLEAVMTDPDFVREVRDTCQHEPSPMQAFIPDDVWQTHLREEARSAAGGSQATIGHMTRHGFYLDALDREYSRPAPDMFTYDIHVFSAYMVEWGLPENARAIPEYSAEVFWEEMADEIRAHNPNVDSVQWEHDTSVVGENEATVSEEWFVGIDRHRLSEFCYDVALSFVDGVVQATPDLALETFEDLVGPQRFLSYETAGLVPGPNTDEEDREEFFDFVHQYLVARLYENDREARWVLYELDELAEVFEAPADDDEEGREVVMEVTRDDLKRLGITTGVLWENAPWRLIKLKPWDLREEGRRMRHCVGQASMGYAAALRDDEVEIWSLRSEAGKPRFTLEVDSSFWDLDNDPDNHDTVSKKVTAMINRAEAIKQLKGKANRPSLRVRTCAGRRR